MTHVDCVCSVCFELQQYELDWGLVPGQAFVKLPQLRASSCAQANDNARAWPRRHWTADILTPEYYSCDITRD